MTVSWRDFASDVQPWAQGAPWSLVEGAIRKAAQELCRFAGVWEDDCTDLTTTISVQTYLLVAPNDYGKPWQPVDVRYDGTASGNYAHIRPKTTPWLDANIPDWRTVTGESVVWYAVLNKGTISVIYIPSATSSTAANLKVRATLQPTEDSTQTDDVLMEYKDTIAHNARYQLMSMPAKTCPWADAKQAGLEYKLWLRGRANAFYEKQRGNTQSGLVAEAPAKWGSK